MSNYFVDLVTGAPWPAARGVALVLALAWLARALRPILLRLLRDRMERYRWEQVASRVDGRDPADVAALAVLARELREPPDGSLTGETGPGPPTRSVEARGDPPEGTG